MTDILSSFDLVLSYPQWQGSGQHENLERGALAAAEVCRRYGPLAEVPLAGEGETAEGINRWTAILDQFRSAQSHLTERRPLSLLTAGGDCAVDVAVIDYLLTVHPNLTVVWVDAHLDANTPTTSPSGNFHGMPVAAIMGYGPPGLPILSAPLSPTRFRYVAADVGDEGDWAFQRANGLRWFDPVEVFDGPVHLHFDLDVLDPAEFPHLAYTDGCLPMEGGVEFVRGIARDHHLVSLTITEFAPADAAAAAAGQQMIAALCDAACTPLQSDLKV